MTDDSYPIAGGAAEGGLVDRGSRFVAWLEPVRSEEEARAHLDRRREQHPAATHHCWAWRLGDPPRERSSDDGEPSGTAGAPILQALVGAGVSDVSAVVARWFGGTKLGRGGLVRAYGGAVREALAALEVARRWRYEELRLTVDYATWGAVERLVTPPAIEVGETIFEERVRCVLRVAPSRLPATRERLRALGVMLL